MIKMENGYLTVQGNRLDVLAEFGFIAMRLCDALGENEVRRAVEFGIKKWKENDEDDTLRTDE